MNPVKVSHDEDIRAYKVLGYKDGELHSPFHDYAWVIGETAAIEEKPDIKEYYYNKVTTLSVEGNAFHTFSTKEHAVKDLTERADRRYWKPEFEKYVIAECLIPSDCKYVYQGAFKTSDDSYVSDKLKVVGIEDCRAIESY